MVASEDEAPMAWNHAEALQRESESTMTDVEKTGKPLPKELQSVDSSLADLGGLGTESITQTDVETPRLKILEARIAASEKGQAQYLDDAEPGDFCNTATGDVWRGEIIVIPCDFHTRYLEWPKVRGKGAPIHDHGEDPSILRRCVTNEKNQHTLPNGNRVEETAFWYLLIQNGAAVGPGAVPVDQHPPQGVAQVVDGDPRRDVHDRR